MQIRSYLLPIVPVVTIATTGIAQANFIDDGGFENGLTGWTLDAANGGSGVYSVANDLFGQGIGQSAFLGYYAAPGQSSLMSNSIVSVAAGTQMQLDFSLAANGLGQIGIFQVSLDASSREMFSTLSTSYMQPLSSYSVTYTAMGAHRIAFGWIGQPTGDLFILDGISVTAVPAPGAIALLGLAGLAGRRRR
jgi:MYXO-CTERM domain-containing protein